MQAYCLVSLFVHHYGALGAFIGLAYYLERFKRRPLRGLAFSVCLLEFRRLALRKCKYSMLQLTGKQCSMCKTWKPFTEFYGRKDRPGQFSGKCKECQLIYLREWKKKNPDKVSKYGKTHYKKHRTAIREKSKAWYERNRETLLASMRKDRKGKDAYLQLMLRSAKSRSKKKGMEFNLDLEYLHSIATDHCPVDGKLFDWERKLAEDKTLQLAIPSLDRIDSSKGYIKGNVKIIGKNWNSKKSNMSLDDLLLLVDYVRNATEAENPDRF